MPSTSWRQWVGLTVVIGLSGAGFVAALAWLWSMIAVCGCTVAP